MNAESKQQLLLLIDTYKANQNACLHLRPSQTELDWNNKRKMNRTVFFPIDGRVANVSLDSISSIKTTSAPYDKPLPSFVENFECYAPPLPKKKEAPARAQAASHWDEVDMAQYESEIALAFGNCERLESYNLDRVMDHPQLPTLPKEAIENKYPPCVPAQQYNDPDIPLSYGLKALVDIKKGDNIGEYIGEFTKKRRGEFVLDYFRDNREFKPPLYIDAEHKGNLMRFVNHSCVPNAEIRCALFSGFSYRNILTAVRDIDAGEFITFKYAGKLQFKCKCGFKNCVQRCKSRKRRK
jgi:hypothetical protein